MKVTNTPQAYINQTYANRTTAKNAPGAPAKPGEEPSATDSINLSATTRDLQRISAAAGNEPAGRAEKVQALKNQVQTNQYNVNAKAVAEKMIGAIMDEMG